MKASMARKLRYEGKWHRRQLDDAGYPYEVAIAGDADSVVLADQVKSLDWKARNAKRKSRVSPAELTEVRGKAMALIGGPSRSSADG